MPIIIIETNSLSPPQLELVQRLVNVERGVFNILGSKASLVAGIAEDMPRDRNNSWLFFSDHQCAVSINMSLASNFLSENPQAIGC